MKFINLKSCFQTCNKNKKLISSKNVYGLLLIDYDSNWFGEIFLDQCMMMHWATYDCGLVQRISDGIFLSSGCEDYSSYRNEIRNYYKITQSECIDKTEEFSVLTYEILDSILDLHDKYEDCILYGHRKNGKKVRFTVDGGCGSVWQYLLDKDRLENAEHIEMNSPEYYNLFKTNHIDNSSLKINDNLESEFTKDHDSLPSI